MKNNKTGEQFLSSVDAMTTKEYEELYDEAKSEGFGEPGAKLFTAADLARAEEKGRRESEAKFWPIFMWLLGYTDWPERKPGEGAFYWRTKLRRDLENTITDFDALLDAKEAGE